MPSAANESPRLGRCSRCRISGGMCSRCRIASVTSPEVTPETTFYDTEAEATTEAARLNAAGILAVAWEEPTWVA